MRLAPDKIGAIEVGRVDLSMHLHFFDHLSNRFDLTQKNSKKVDTKINKLLRRGNFLA